MEAVTTIRCFAVVALLCTTGLSEAFEPFDIKGSPEETPTFDHLLPVDRAISEFHYLAQYWAKPQYEAQRYVVVVRDNASGRYYVEQGPPPKSEVLLNRPYKFTKRIEISSETADVIHELWATALLQTRYDPKSESVIITNATRCTFSTFVLNIGWMHGYCWYPAPENDLPPTWMYNAGEALFEFVTKSHDEPRLRQQIKSIRDRFYEYMKTHERPAGR